MNKLFLLPIFLLVLAVFVGADNTDCFVLVKGKVLNKTSFVGGARIEVECTGWLQNTKKVVYSDKYGNYKTVFFPFECWSNDSVKVYAEHGGEKGISQGVVGKNFLLNMDVFIDRTEQVPLVPEFSFLSFAGAFAISVFLIFVMRGAFKAKVFK